MSQSIASTLAAAPTTLDVAQRILATMAALSGVATDYNQGSQIRTVSESLGSVVEMQSVAAQQQAYVGLTYGSIAAYGITPFGAQYATGYVTFSTSNLSSPPPASQNVTIQSGTLIQTAGGVQFQTTAAVILANGASAVTVAVAAIVPGISGNVSAGTITNIISGLGYPLYVTNAAATTGGSAAEAPSNTLARAAAAQAALGNCTPFAVANAAIGVTYGAETVMYASCYEGWIAAGSGAGSGTAGFTLYIDNGLGAASANLIAAVNTKISGNATLNAPGNRPVGMPYTIQAVTPVYANVTVTGTLQSYIQVASVTTSIQSATNANFAAQGIGGTVSQSTLSASVANAGEGYFTSLSVVLTTSGGSTVPSITAAYNQRVILLGLNLAGVTTAT